MNLTPTTAANVFSARNNAGAGFDPSAAIDTWTLVLVASSTSDVSIYTDESGATVLVGTDGIGSDDSRWAVRIPPVSHDLVSSIADLTFHVRPVDAGQAVEISYASDWESECLIRCEWDRSEGTRVYAAAPIEGGEFEPQNGTLPDVGDWVVIEMQH